jgi:hypothetical protein
MSSCTKVKLNPAIDMHRRSMNEDRGWGAIAEREGENSGCASSRPAIHPCRLISTGWRNNDPS